MDYQPGQFRTFRAINKVHLGALAMDLPEGALVQFDGQTLRWGTKDYNLPALASGIKVGWLMEVESAMAPMPDTVPYRPKPAGVMVHPATTAGTGRVEAMQMEPATEEHHDVGSIADAKARREAAAYIPVTRLPTATVSAPESSPVEVEYDTPVATAPVRAAIPAPTPLVRTITPTARRLVMKVDEDATPVARFLTPTVTRPVVGDAAAATSETAKLDATHGNGPAVEHLNRPPAPRRKSGATHVTTGIPISATLPGGATGDVAEARSGEHLADLLPDAATSGTPRPGVVEEKFGETRLAWDMSGPWRQRVKVAVDLYGNDCNALRQILEIESPAVVKFIRSELARIAAKVPH